jgi:hypothetical protein
MSLRKTMLLLYAFFFISGIPVAAGEGSAKSQQQNLASNGAVEMEQAAQWIRAEMGNSRSYDYVLGASVRLLLFWVSRDDVGQGTIRIGEQALEPGTQRIELIMGSDPAKAPFHVNRWGAAKETYRTAEGTGDFFGFMKSSAGDSPFDARAEIAKEKAAGAHQFTGIVSRHDRSRMISVAVPISSLTDFNIRELPQAEQMVVKEISASNRTPRVRTAADLSDCSNAKGFLFTIRELLRSSLDGMPLPQTRCYLYHTRRYLMTLSGGENIREKGIAIQFRGTTKPVTTTYKNLRDARFRVVNTESGERTDFRILYGADGEYRGIPLVMEHQPNWWFRITVKLNPQTERNHDPK